MTMIASLKEDDGLAQMFALAPSFMALVLGPHHRFVHANPAYELLVGRTHLVGLTVGDALPEVADQGFITLLDRVFLTGVPFVADEMPIRLNRSADVPELRYVSFVYQPIRDSNGAISGIMSHGMDVTAQVQARRDLEERESYFRSLLEHSHDKVSVIAPDGTILYESAAVTRLLGWNVDEVIGRNITELIHPDDRDIALQGAQRAVERMGEPQRVEVRLLHHSGDARPFEVIGHARKSLNGIEIIVNSRDITERRAAEERARESEERFHVLAESSPDYFMLFHSVRNDEGQIIDFEWIYTNPGASALTGRSHQDLFGRRLIVEMGDKLDPGMFEAYVHVVETGESWTGGFERNHDGKHYAFRTHAARVGDGVAITFSDASEEYRTRAEMREGEARFRALVELIPQLVWSTRPDGYHDYFNQRWYDYTGMVAGDGQGWNWKDYLHPDDYQRSVDAWSHALRTGEPYETEYRFRRRDGEYRWFIGRALPLSGADGSIERWFGTCTDVHDETLALESARSSEARFTAVARATNDVVWDWELATGQLWWNDNLERVLLHERSQLSENIEAWTGNIHPEDRERVTSGIRRAIDERQSGWSDEYRFIRGDGSIATVLDRGMLVLDPNGTPVRMLGSMIDLTDRIQLEAELRQSHKLEAVGKLAGGVAHDFNNLLTVITSYTEMLLSELPEGTPARGDVDEIRRATNRASDLTRQLLAFSRRQVLQPRDLDLNEAVREIEKMLRRVIGDAIAIDCQLDGSIGHVLADPGQVEQVIMNLALNARDAMHEGGTLTFGTAGTTIDDVAYSVLSVTDTGVGMDDGVLARAFEPFFTTKPQGQGTGLGLATVHGIVTQSGGQVDVQTAPGVGTTVRILLPVTEARSPKEVPVAAPAPVRHGNATLLVVEDQPAVRSIACRTLRSRGYTVYEAENGRAALEMLAGAAADADLVITDLAMPEMGGRELARQLGMRKNSPPILFMSGYAEEDMRIGEGLDSDALLLEKPFTMRQLLDSVAVALGRAG